MSRIAQNLKFLRKQKKFTQVQFADFFKVKKSLIGAYEEARAEPKLLFLNRVAKAFDITLDELVNKNLFTKSVESFIGTSLEVYKQEGRSFKKTAQRCLFPVDFQEETILFILEKENKFFSQGSFLVSRKVIKLTELNQHDVLLDSKTGVIEKVSHINFSNSDYYKILYAIEKVKGKEKNGSLDTLTETVMQLQSQILNMNK